MTLLCPSSELEEGQSKGFTVREQSIFIVRKYGKVYGYLNRCPHVGAPLEWRPNDFLNHDGELIQCAMHGALFTIDSGLCVSGPCANQSLQAISVTEQDNQIFLTSDSLANAE